MTHWGTRLGAWLALVGGLAALGYASTGKPPKDALYRYDTAANELVLFAFVAFVLLLITLGLPKRPTFALRPPESWPKAIWLSFLTLVAVAAVTAVVTPFLNPGKEQGLTTTHWQSDRAGQFVANYVVFTFVGPAVEELTFRGLGFRLLARLGRPFAIVAIGILFGVWHGLVTPLPILAVFGALLALIRSRTHSVYPCIGLHAFFNGAQLLASVL